MKDGLFICPKWSIIFIDILHVLSIINQFSLLCSSLSFHTHFSHAFFNTHNQRILKHIPQLLSPHTLRQSRHLHGYISLITPISIIYDVILHPVRTTILTQPDHSTLSESRLDTAQTTRAILPPLFTSVYVWIFADIPANATIQTLDISGIDAYTTYDVCVYTYNQDPIYFARQNRPWQNSKNDKNKHVKASKYMHIQYAYNDASYSLFIYYIYDGILSSTAM